MKWGINTHYVYRKKDLEGQSQPRLMDSPFPESKAIAIMMGNRETKAKF